MSGTHKTEIEYKFGIRNAETFDFLTNLSSAGGYRLEDKSRPHFTDIFYDTPDFLLFSLGFYLRKRQESGKEEAVWTLKQADTSGNEAHRRRELIQALSSDSTPEDLSDPDFEKELRQLLGDADLIPVLTLEQNRVFKTVFQKEPADTKKILAELSVDTVSLQLSAQKHFFTELEAELSDGTENELEEFIQALKALPELQGNLFPNSFSKFERGLILYFNRDKIEGKATGEAPTEYDSAGSRFLLPREKAVLLQLSGKTYAADPTDYFGSTGFLNRSDTVGKFGLRNSDLFSQAAAVLLSLDAGMTPGFTAQAFGMTEAEICGIRDTFHQSGIGMFPFVFEAPSKEVYSFQKSIEESRAWTPGELADYYGIDQKISMRHAQNAEKLFDFAGSAAGLTEKEKTILSAAAQLFEVGKGLSAEKKVHTPADIILTHPIRGLSLNDIKVLALVFILKDVKKTAPETIKRAIHQAGFFVPPAGQKKAVLLTAFLEAAVFGFEAPAEIQKTELLLEGGAQRSLKIYYSREAGEPVSSKQNYIAYAFDFEVKYEEENAKAPEKEAEKPDLTLRASDMMAVAAEKILIRQWLEIEKAEPGVRAAEDIEEVHDMRVALRKIRSAILIFRDFLEENWLAETEAGVKKTLAGLGELRDLDVLLEKTDEWRAEKKIGKEQLSVFYDTVSADRQKAHLGVVAYLTSPEYIEFMAGVKKTLDTHTYLGNPHITRKGDVAPVRIYDVLPGILYEKAADITAYHEWMDGPYIYADKLHRLRIAAKNFRYTLDFFKDCLGDAAGHLVKEFKELQDILGNFHDAVVAVEVIEAYERRIAAEKDRADYLKKRDAEITLQTLEKYKGDRSKEMETLIAAFHVKWEKMDRRFFNDRIAKIIAEANF